MGMAPDTIQATFGLQRLSEKLICIQAIILTAHNIKGIAVVIAMPFFVVLSLILVPILLSSLFLFWFQNYSHVGKHLKKLDGPGLPLVGVLFDYFTSAEQIFKNDRDRCDKYGKIFKLWILHKSSILLKNPEDIEVLLSSTKHTDKSDLYSLVHMWLGAGLLTSAGQKWKLRRRMLTPAFHYNILKGFVDIFNESTEKLIHELENTTEQEIDVIPYITEFTLQSIAESSMGTYLDIKDEKCKNYKKCIANLTEALLHRLSRVYLHNDNIFKLVEKGRFAKKSVDFLHEFTRSIIRERKRTMEHLVYSKEKKLAMLDLIIKMQKDEGLIDDEGIREEVDTFMFEGHDTTSVVLCYMLLTLANYPKIQGEARTEILELLGETRNPHYEDLQNLPYIERVIKETLRLYPSVPLIGRNIREDFTTASGYTVPKGTMVHAFIFDLHRDPELYPDPLKFDPDRFLPENPKHRHPFAFLPFSAGPRNCIGQRFAMLEMKAVLCGILRKFILEAVDKRENLVFVSDLVLRSKNPIRVKFLKRKV